MILRHKKRVKDVIRDVRLGDFRVVLVADNCEDTIGYKVFDKGRLVFDGDDFLAQHPEDDQAILNLLSFLSKTPEEAEGSEYVENYTDEQLDWVYTRGAELSSTLADYEEGAVELEDL